MTQRFKFFLRQPGWIAAICISLAIIWFHLFFWTHAGGFWRDEVNSINIASRHSLSGMSQDSFPVLMPLVVHGWLALGFGKTDLQLRALGLLIGLGIPAALWAAGWKTRRSPPLLGLTLFGLNSTLIVFGDSIRAYGLGCLLIILAAASACAFLKKTSWMRAGWLTLFSVLSVQALYQNAILVAAICIGTWAVCWRRKDWRAAVQIFIAGVLAAISLLPYAQNLISGRESSSVLRTGVKLPRFFASYGDTLGFPLAGYIYVWALLAAVVAVCACVALRRIIKTSAKNDGDFAADDLHLFGGITLLVAAAGFPLFFWRAGMPMQSWYQLPLMALAVTCFDATLPALRGIVRAAFFVFVVATALIAIPTTSRILNCHFTNVDSLARQLTAEAAPEDYIVVVPWFCGITFEDYFKGATPWDTLPPLADHSIHRYDLVKIQLQNTNAIAPVLRQIITTLQSGHRVWILAGLGWMDVPDPGTSAPSSLPPAPLKLSGWSETPYTMVWASQVGHLVGDHSLQFDRVKNHQTERLVIENTELFMAGGWKESTPASPAQQPKPQKP